MSAGLSLLLGRGTPAQATELHVMISDGMKTVVEELTPQIEHSIGRKLAAQFNSSKNLRDKIQTGEPFDAAILTSDVLDDLIQQGKIAAGGGGGIFPPGGGGGGPGGRIFPAPGWEWASAPGPRNQTSARRTR